MKNRDKVYQHFSGLGVNIKYLWKRSHPEDRKKLFEVKMTQHEVKYVMKDVVMESKNIRKEKGTDFFISSCVKVKSNKDIQILII